MLQMIRVEFPDREGNATGPSFSRSGSPGSPPLQAVTRLCTFLSL